MNSELITLENDDICIHVNPIGAELYSIKTKPDKHEWLWQGDKRYFAQRAPILFPVIGFLKDGVYAFEGEQYAMPLHGFAHHMAFAISDRDSDSLKFTLTDDASTREVYPFTFRLDVTYRISGASVDTQFAVTNASAHTMYFSVGGHPAFNVPFASGDDYDDYFIEFEQEERLERRLFENRLFTGERRLILDNSRILELNHDLFFTDKAVVLDDVKSDVLWIRSRKGPRALRFEFPGFPYLGLWSTPGAHAPFLCVEPWYGIGADRNDKPAIELKEGIVALSSGDTFTCGYNVALE
jgi:galactose mutarotase-like enzyme